jgi:DNA primase
MNEGNIRQLLERLGCQKIRKRGDEISCSCPFSDKHKRGDRRPSFGVKISSDDASPYNCFACGERGVLEHFAVTNGYSDLVPGYKPRSAAKKSWHYKRRKNAGAFSTPKNTERPILFKDDYLEPFIGVYSAYVRDRGISIETAREWELGKDDRHKRATFTVRDYKGRLAVVIGRDITNKSFSKYSNYVLDRRLKRMVPFIDRKREMDFLSPTKSFFLYGEHKVYPLVSSGERAGQDLIVVEGPMDVLAMWQWGWMTVGVLGSYPSRHQVDKLVSMTPRNGRLIVLADSDTAGQVLTDGIKKEINGRIPVYDADLEPGRDPADSTRDGVKAALDDARNISLTS